jgi:hypothetical protein
VLAVVVYIIALAGVYTGIQQHFSKLCKALREEATSAIIAYKEVLLVDSLL